MSESTSDLVVLDRDSGNWTRHPWLEGAGHGREEPIAAHIAEAADLRPPSGWSASRPSNSSPPSRAPGWRAQPCRSCRDRYGVPTSRSGRAPPSPLRRCRCRHRASATVTELDVLARQRPPAVHDVATTCGPSPVSVSRLDADAGRCRRVAGHRRVDGLPAHRAAVARGGAQQHLRICSRTPGRPLGRRRLHLAAALPRHGIVLPAQRRAQRRERGWRRPRRSPHRRSDG